MTIWIFIGAVVALVASLRFVRRVEVQDGRVALLFRTGRYVRELKAGSHWLFGWSLRTQEVDVREAALTVQGQEVLTADQLTVKISVVLRYRIVNAEQAFRSVQNYYEQLYQSVQESLRVAVAAKKLDEILVQREQLVEAMQPLIAEQAERLGLKAERVMVRDFMLSGELKEAYAEVVKARMEGAAALERARGESASLRNLANATQLLETHPGLFQLRYLQTIDQALTSGNGHTLMVGVPANQPPIVVKR